MITAMHLQNIFPILLISAVEAITYTNPVIGVNTPDPGILSLHTGGYAVVATSDHSTDSTLQHAFPLYYSEDLVTWQLQGHVFPYSGWPSWAVKNMWAPEIHYVGSRYLVYFSGSAPNGRHSIGVAIGTSDPFGQYEDLGAPLVYHNDDSVVGPIDQSYFLDPSTGKHYLVWKTDHISRPGGSDVVLQELNEDGVSFAEGSERHVIMQDDQPEEQRIVEGPWLMFRDNTYYLFYSSSLYFTSYYHMGVAKSSHILGPYTKRNTPVVETDWERYNAGMNSTWEGPGHGSVVADSAGDWWLAYHSWQYGHLNREPGRVMLLDKLMWHGFPSPDLWPMVERGVPSDTPQEAPRV